MTTSDDAEPPWKIFQNHITGVKRHTFFLFCNLELVDEKNAWMWLDFISQIEGIDLGYFAMKYFSSEWIVLGCFFTYCFTSTAFYLEGDSMSLEGSIGYTLSVLFHSGICQVVGRMLEHSQHVIAGVCIHKTRSGDVRWQLPGCFTWNWPCETDSLSWIGWESGMVLQPGGSLHPTHQFWAMPHLCHW